jgi:tetratricopeptide (TPR) repeat protein
MAQKSVPDTYAGESMVLEHADVVYAMNADGTGYMQKTVVVKLQSAAALQQLGIIGMEFAANSQRAEFHYVRVRRPDGSLTETPVADAIEEPLQVTVQAPFYSDLKVAQIPVKNLQVGDTLEWEGRVVTTKPEAPNEFWGTETFVTEGSVVREQSMELRVPAATAVTVWTNPALGIQVKESKEGDEKIYRWESSALKPTVGPEADAAREAKKKHVLTADEELDQEQGKLPSVAWTTFPSWPAVGEWYRRLVANRTTPDDEIKAKVAELTAGKTTEEDKVRAIYGYVSTQIRYIGVAFGVGRFQPHQAVDVLHNQYGDCKDKATLLSAMLAAAGVPSDEALIGAGVRFDEAVPSPASFNHLITHLKLNGRDVWLDSTEEVAPYRMVYAGLRDREALVVPPTGAPMLEKTAADPPFMSYQTWTATGSLDANGTSDSKITVVSRGDGELVLRAVVRQLGPAQYDEFAQRLVGAMGYAGTSSHPEFGRTDDLNDPFTMSFDYHREKNGDWDDLKIIPQLAPMSLPTVDEKEPPVATIDLGAPRTEMSTAEMKLPTGWKAELPEAVHERTAFATYDESYRFDQATLYSERKLVVLEQKIPAKDWKIYKKWTDAIGLGNDTYVQLRRGPGASAELPPAATGALPGSSKQEQIDALMKQVQEAFNLGEANRLESLLEQIEARDPKTQRLMGWKGALAMMRGNMDEAIADNRKELELFPEEFDRYGAIVGLQGRKHDKTGMEATFRQWAQADPGDAKPLGDLAQMEYQDKRYADAEAYAQRALALAPQGTEHEGLELVLGESQIGSKDVEKATATLTALLKSSDDPLIMNDAAYTLADAGQPQALAVAEEAEKAGLQKLTAETASWTLDEAPATLRSKTSLLIASWDTMGWILFREGKAKEAKTYIAAAWQNKPDDDVKQHLNKVNAALGISETPHHPPMPKADVTVTTTAMSGQELRTIPLGAANGRSRVAEYRLLLSHGGVERAKPTGEKTMAGADEMLKRTNFTRFFPEGSEAKMVRQGMVNCFMNKCQLVLEP